MYVWYKLWKVCLSSIRLAYQTGETAKICPTNSPTNSPAVSDHPTIRYVTMLELLIEHTGSIPVIVLDYVSNVYSVLMSSTYILMKRMCMPIYIQKQGMLRIRYLRIFCMLMCLFGVKANTYVCEYCAADTFCYQDLSTSCPQDSSSPSGSTSLSDCLCDPGFYPLFDEHSKLVSCEFCLPNQWCPGGSQMFPCTSHSTSATAATSPLQCICDAGFFGLGNSSCTQCPAGTYKTIDSHVCLQCPVGTYNPEEAGIDPQVCIACPDLSTSVHGSREQTQCVSVFGSYSSAPGQAGQLCPASTYQDQLNRTTCELCDVGKYQPISGSQSANDCLTCPTHSSIIGQTGTSIHNCSCDPGFTGSDATACNVCASGHVKSTQGFEDCVACVQNSFASVDHTLCVSCPGNSSAPPFSDNSLACECNAGYEGVDEDGNTWLESTPVHVCRSCAQGFFKKVGGNEECQVCASGTFSASSGSTECMYCPENTHTISTGTTACVNCLPNEFSPEASTSREACLCVEGFYRYNGLCTECPVGTYRNDTHASLNTATCTSCPDGMYTQDNELDICSITFDALPSDNAFTSDVGRFDYIKHND